MRRIPLVLAVIAGVLPLLAGAAAAQRAASPPNNTSLPTISGTAQQGHTLSASNGMWGGATPIAYTYQWQRCSSAGSSCGSISSATNQNYVASSGDVGRTIRVEVTASNADGKTQALSTATSAIASSGNAPANTKQPNPSGTAQEGRTVTVDTGAWSGLKPITFTFQWQSCTAVNSVCTNLAGMTKSSFLIGGSQVGALLRATVVATNAAGKTSAFSNATAIVIARAIAPVNVSLPAISGSAHVGQRISASTGAWNGNATGFSYQWSRCNSNGSSCADVYGATGSSYGLGQADLGTALRVIVTATNITGSTRATSAASVIGARIVTIARFSAVLRAGQELTRPKGAPAAAVGHFTAKLTGTTLRWTLTFSHLSGRPTVARLNKGLRGTNGATFKSLCRRCLSPTRGTTTITASQRDAMLRHAAYVNVHTTKNTRGEIRGQINRVS